MYILKWQFSVNESFSYKLQYAIDIPVEVTFNSVDSSWLTRLFLYFASVWLKKAVSEFDKNKINANNVNHGRIMIISAQLLYIKLTYTSINNAF